MRRLRAWLLLCLWPKAFVQLARRDLLTLSLVARAEVYSETDQLGEVWTTASVLKRRAKELQKLREKRPSRAQPLPRAFVTYLTRVLINYDLRSNLLWQTGVSKGPEAMRAQFAALAAAVDLGIIGAYGASSR